MKRFYEFGNFRVEIDKRLLWKDDKAIRLKPKTFNTLLFLLKNRHKVVTKNEIIGEIWNGTAVSDDSLTQQISQIRKILDDKEHRFITTVPGVGYEFLADVRETTSTDDRGVVNNERDGNLSAEQTQTGDSSIPVGNAESPEPTEPKQPKTFHDHPKRINWRIWATAFMSFAAIGTIAVYIWQQQKTDNTTALGVRKIAILPFKTFSQDSETDMVKMVLTDALITKLSQLEQIQVLPTSAVSRFNKSDQDPLEAGRELKVDAVLEGRVRKEGDRLRVTAQLIKVSDGTTIWAESYNEDFSDIQYELARKITEALSLELSDAEKRHLTKRYTASPEAYRLWLEGRDIFGSATADGTEIARKNFLKAIALDPKFALPYVSLANTYMLKPPKNLSRKDAYLKAKELARQAIEIDETLPDAHTSYAFAIWRGEWNWLEAETHFQRGVDLQGRANNIYNWYMLLLIGTERFDQAAILIQQSPVRDNPIFLGHIHLAKRDFDKSIKLFQDAAALRPTDHNALVGLGWSYAGKGDYEQALEFIEKDLVLSDQEKDNIQSVKAYILARAERKDEARKILAQLNEASDSDSNLNGARAIIYAALGEKNRAFELLEKGIEEREWWCYLLKVHFMFDPLRDDPRFEELLRRVNLAD
jgi:TolB-like protein/DNA-binding winged helix-turn-helix (wHTH) protein/Tfp pilus assembly protein PilF